MAPNVSLYFYPANDLNGTPLHVITDEDSYFKDLKLKLDLYGLGGGELVLARKVGFAAFGTGTFGMEAFVRVLVHAYSDTEFLTGFFLEKRNQTVIHVDEDGGEEFHLGGPGPKAYLERCRLQPSQIGNEGWNLDLANGVYRWNENATAGRILNRLIREDELATPESLPDLTKTFTDTEDSDSVTWVNDIAEPGDYEIPIGQTLLQSLWDLEDEGELVSVIKLGTVASPKFELNAYQSYGTDASGSSFGSGVALLREGVNIVNDSLEVEGVALRKCSHVIIEGKDGVWATAVRTAWDPGEYVKWGKIEYPRSSRVAVLERVGLRWLRRQEQGDQQYTVAILPGHSDAAGLYFPQDGPLALGNVISLDTSADGTTHTALDIQPSEVQVVTGFELDLLEASRTDSALEADRSWDVKVKLNYERGGQSGTPDQSSAATGSTCNCLPASHPAPECTPQPDDNELIDWDWSGCAVVGWTDALSGVPHTNAWGNYASPDYWTGSPGCSTGAKRGESYKWAIDPGDVITVAITAARYGGAGGSWPTNLEMRFYNSSGVLISAVGQSINMGGLSHEGGDHGNYITSTVTWTAPAGAEYASLKQTTWSTFFVQHVRATTPAAVVGNVPYCVDYGGFPHSSPDGLPSDYILSRFQALLDALAGLELNSLVDVDASPADGDVLTWDDTAGQWVADAPSGGGTFGTPAIVLGTAAVAGSINEAIRRDSTIVAFDGTAPTTEAMGDAAATGSAAVAARRDHKHGMPAFGTTAANIGTSAGGSATTPSKSDHVHATGAGTPSTQAFGDAAATGTGPAAAMTDHKHAMPANPVTAHEAASDPHTGYVLESLLDAKGDLIVASADNTPGRLAVGSDGKILVADTSQALGVKWSNPDSLSLGSGGRGEYGGKYNPDHETPATTPGVQAEFNGALDSGWGWESSSPPSTEDYSTYPGYLYWVLNGTGGNVLYKAWSPGATDLTIAAKLLMSKPVNNTADTTFAMLGVSDANNGLGSNNCLATWKATANGASTGSLYDRNAGSFVQIGSGFAPFAERNTPGKPLYLRLTRTVSGPTWRAYFSWDGITWTQYATTSSKSITVAGVVLRISDQPLTTAVDWIRAWGSIVERVGA